MAPQYQTEIRTNGITVTNCGNWGIAAGIINIGRRTTIHVRNKDITAIRNESPYSVPSPEESLNSQVKQFVGRNIGSDWRTLATSLGFSYEAVDNLYLEYGQEGRETICEQMLCTWARNQGDHATKRALQDTLIEIGRKDIACRLPC